MENGNPRQERIVMSGAAGVAALLSAIAAAVDSAWGLDALAEAMHDAVATDGIDSAAVDRLGIAVAGLMNAVGDERAEHLAARLRKRAKPADDQDQAATELVHAFLPIGIRAPEPRCGAAPGRMALDAYDVTCPACRALLAVENGGAS